MDNNDITPEKSEDLQIQEFEDEVLLYDSRNQKVHVLNPTAYFIWTLCDGSRSLKEIKEKMEERFHITKDLKIIDDIQNIFDEFKRKGLIK